MARSLPLALLLLAALGAAAQDGALPFTAFHQFTDSLDAIAAIPDADDREVALDALWADLVAAEQVPFRLADSVAFLHRSTASSVAVAGDHNGWNPGAGPMSQLEGTDLWRRVHRFPEAARIDYKLVRGSTWILDPANPHVQWSGFGPNSELRMPAWVFPEETVRGDGVPEGDHSSDLSLESTRLGYTVRYRVYTPMGYDEDGLTDLPVLYVTDGHEYADDRLGAARIVLDNLIADERAEPTIAVFIDPRVNGQNLRAEQYVQNPDFAAFVAEELVPEIDAAYRTRASRDGRVILGTSLGGVFSTYLGLRHPDVFGKLAIQSPAYWVTENAEWWSGPSLFETVGSAEDGIFEVVMTTGTINDGEHRARRMRDTLLAHGHAVAYREVPEGHSWGNWRALIDEVLVHLLPGPNATAAEPDASGAVEPLRSASGVFDLDAFPNPAGGLAGDRLTLRFALDRPAPVRLDVLDLAGRRVRGVLDRLLPTGEHAATVDTAGLAPGAYVVRLRTNAGSAARLVAVVW